MSKDLIQSLPVPYNEKEWDKTMKAMSKQSMKKLSKEVDAILMTKTMTTTEAAQQLGVSERTVRNMIERGSIDAHKLDPQAKSVYRIPTEEVQRILRERAKITGRRAAL